MDEIIFRSATIDDLSALVTMLADDTLGSSRESVDDLTLYRAAFAEIDDDPRQELLVAEHRGAVVGTAQLSRAHQGCAGHRIGGLGSVNGQPGHGVGD